MFAAKSVDRGRRGRRKLPFLERFHADTRSASRFSVVVYVHGGRFEWGSGHELGLSPDIRVAHEFNVVFVSFNYRLSVFGWLALDLRSNATDLGGNYGLHDQILALKWVKENIVNFGGDADKVTVFAHGSGAASALALLGSVYAKGLFQRLWLSGVRSLDYATLDEAKLSNENFLRATNCTDLDCLLKMDSRNLLEIYLDAQRNSTTRLTIDGDIVRATVDDMWKNELLNDVPLLMGSTAQDESMPLPPESVSWNILQFKKFARRIPDLISEKNLDLFAHLYYNESDPRLGILSAMTDKKRICPLNFVSNQATTALLSPVYRYVVTGRLSRVIRLPWTDDLGRYSFAGIDLIAFFGLLGHYIDEPSEDDFAFKDQMQALAVDFIRCGSMQMSSWKPYPKTLAEVSSRIDPASNYHQEQCQFWKHIANN